MYNFSDAVNIIYGVKLIMPRFNGYASFLKLINIPNVCFSI